ncbi:MAG: hypothetical protein EB121_05815 [Alphaproteobacteria bacterium]|nr:hypothetical protein [Alphaproteobacteria bacterium]NDG04848.1 hypothetical protein [Alphaproteobacteria bacterium]
MMISTRAVFLLILTLLILTLCAAPVWAQQFQFWPPQNLEKASPSLPKCVPGNVVTYRPDLDPPGMYCEKAASKPRCQLRKSTSLTKGPCGATAQVLCQKGEYLLTGGVRVSNASAQSSYPLVGDDGTPNGWAIAVLNDGSNACEINNWVKDGTVVNGDFPSLQIGPNAYLWAEAHAVCCTE